MRSVAKDRRDTMAIVHEENNFQRNRQKAINEELVPLAVASTIAYHHVTDAVSQVSETATLAEIVHPAAIALSTVAQIFRIADQPLPLNAREVRELLFRPPGDIDPLELDRFGVRRGDLRAALATLKEARSAFGKP